jgi:hypothetical protein
MRRTYDESYQDVIFRAALQTELAGLYPKHRLINRINEPNLFIYSDNLNSHTIKTAMKKDQATNPT